jgi:hypothetical protein
MNTSTYRGALGPGEVAAVGHGPHLVQRAAGRHMRTVGEGHVGNKGRVQGGCLDRGRHGGRLGSHRLFTRLCGGRRCAGGSGGGGRGAGGRSSRSGLLVGAAVPGRPATQKLPIEVHTRLHANTHRAADLRGREQRNGRE